MLNCVTNLKGYSTKYVSEQLGNGFYTELYFKIRYLRIQYQTKLT